MRILSLTIEGFGPFAGREEINFEKLSSEGLYLIAGPTGAGKTSILDAICFALYGRVPGARDEAKQLRSQFASSNTPTQVILECEVRDKRIKIERSPAYERPKQRGTGYTTQRPSVSYFERVGSEWIGRAHKYEEVGSLIRETVGLTADQFTRVIMLPQGDFAAFLRAEPKEREAILERLFGTERFGQVAEYLRKLQSEANSRTTQIVSTRRQRITSMLNDAEADSLQDSLTRMPSLANVVAAASVACVQADEKWQVAEQVRLLAETELRRAEKDCEHSQQRYDDAVLLAEYKQRAQEFDQAEYSALREHVQLLRRAHGVKPIWTNYERAQKMVDELTRRLERAAQDGPDTAVDALRELYESARLALNAFNELDTLETEHGLIITKVSELRSQVEVLTSRIHDESQRLTELGDLHVREIRMRDSQRALDDIHRTVERVSRIDRLLGENTQKYERLSHELEEAVTRTRVAQADFDAIRAKRLAGIAGELASELENSQPCPVCGSCDHPSPALKREDAPTKEQEENAYSRMNELLDAQSKVQSACSSAHATVNQLEKDRAEFPESSELTTTLAECQSEYDRAKEEYERVKSERESAEASLTSQQDKLQKAHSEAEEAEKERVRLEGLIDRKRQDTSVSPKLAQLVDCETGTNSDTARAFESHVKYVLRKAEEIEAIRTELKQSKEHLRACETEWQNAFATSALASLDEFHQLCSENLSQNEQRLDAMTSVGNALERDRSQEWYSRAVKESDPIEILKMDAESKREVYNRLERSYEAAGNRAYHQQREYERTIELRTETLSTVGADEAEIERNERVSELSQIVSATSQSNTQKVTLKSFALAEWFAQVTRAASERLVEMTGGRYTLEQAYEPQAGQNKGGLLLRIIDEYTLAERDPRTLSGGESFMASLSLALGLADTVLAHAGGIELDSLFIDEGFGSLDPESLNAVMSVLDELRTGGRCIGLISHVEDMRQTIPNKLLVTPSPTGSTTSVQVHESKLERD